MGLLVVAVLFHVFVANALNSLQQQQPPQPCHDEERSALLQFKDSFIIKSSASIEDGAYPKVSSWKSAHDNSSSCCSWDGVECDEKTGHVIGLNLQSSCLFGSIYSNSTLFHLSHLQSLNLSDNHFNDSDILSSITTLPNLTRLHLSNSVLTGQVPPEISRLSKLIFLDVSTNYFHGSIPESLSNLIHLETIRLFSNRLTGRVEFNMFLRLQNLTELLVGDNELEMVFESTTSSNASSFPKLERLGLAACNIREFPQILRYQQNLVWLKLSGNKIQGRVPKWMWNTSIQSLQFIDISYNLLSGFESPPVDDVLPWLNLHLVKLSSNMLHGSLPIPPPTTAYYGISDNNLSGQMSPSVCNLTSLRYLDLSNNNLSGQLPQCLGNFSEDLRVLNLGNNSFQGTLPQTYSKRSNLMMFDVSNNKLHGQIPRSLANCVRLEFMAFTGNKFDDVFPFWLGTLPELKLLAMSHNHFFGVIGKILFPKLRILDLSYNNFIGEFPSESGNAMRGFTLNESTYMKADLHGGFPFRDLNSIVYSIWITNKGLERYYEKIPEDFALIDLSNNKFEGEIPNSIGKLKGLRFLNLSNNLLTSSIPSSLGNLTLLESLDLSNNNLSGEIPQQLAQLTFLAKLNVSHNNLRGHVPYGTQFSTFDITSFDGNPRLCGDPMPKKCGNNPNDFQPPASTTEEINLDAAFELDWKFVLAGVASGLVVGVVLADVAIASRQELFLKIVGILFRLIP